jgi:hypothetical protein
MDKILPYFFGGNLATLDTDVMRRREWYGIRKDRKRRNQEGYTEERDGKGRREGEGGKEGRKEGGRKGMTWPPNKFPGSATAC